MFARIRNTYWLVAMAVLFACKPCLAQISIPVGHEPVFSATNSISGRTFVTNYEDTTVSVIDRTTLTVVGTVPVGKQPIAVAVNSVTNKAYVTNCDNDGTCSSLGSLAVIDGATLAVRQVQVGIIPADVAVNSVTNTIYVVNECGNDSSCSSGSVTVINGNTLATRTVSVATYGGRIAVNSVTNQIWVLHECFDCFGIATVIDGATLSTRTVRVGVQPADLAIDPTTDKTIVANACGNDTNCGGPGTATVIDGATLAAQTVTVGYDPLHVAIDPVRGIAYLATNDDGVNVLPESTLGTFSVSICTSQTLPGYMAMSPVTNQLYIPCYSVYGSGAGAVTILDGSTFAAQTYTFGEYMRQASVDQTNNTVYVVDSYSNVVWFFDGFPAPAAQFVPVTPCRLVDTRDTHSPVLAGTSQSFALPDLGGCHVPANATAYSLNVTVVPHAPLGYLTIWPTGEDQPVVSTLNSPDGRVKANAAIVPAGAGGAVSVYATNTTDVILDIDGYFSAPGQNTLAFYPLEPCRVIDTRGSQGALGGPYLHAQRERDFPVRQSGCIPSNVSISAYSMNFTVVPHQSGQPLGYLSVWPEGESQPVVSTLNNPTATVVANAAVVPAGSGGGIATYAYNDTDLIVDINGYFAEPDSSGLSFYPAAPCRVYDSRNNNGQPFSGRRTVDVATSVCVPGSSQNVQAYIFNATVVPNGSLGYLTLWPDGQSQPVASTLNAYDGYITSNMAMVPTTNGDIDAYASGMTHLILDISGYFAP